MDRYLKEYKEVSKSFTDVISITITIPVSKVPELENKLIELTKNEIKITKSKETSRVL